MYLQMKSILVIIDKKQQYKSVLLSKLSIRWVCEIEFKINSQLSLLSRLNHDSGLNAEH